MQLKCLSIQQPFADLIISGRKRVENRSWTWMRQHWEQKGSGPVLLGIHASTRMAALSAEELDDYVPGWRSRVYPVLGCVIGVVNLTQICRPKDLPVDLREHEFVNHDSDNWCWVLEKPKKLIGPVRATGNARLFHVEVPDELLPKELGS